MTMKQNILEDNKGDYKIACQMRFEINCKLGKFTKFYIDCTAILLHGCF